MPFTPFDYRDAPGDLTTPLTAVNLEARQAENAAYAEALAYPVVPFKRFSNLAFNGATDVIAAINAALISLRDAGGGLLGLPSTGMAAPGIISAPVVLQNRTGIVGGGQGATTLKLADGVNSSADMVINYVSTNAIEPNGQLVVVRDLRLDGNRANNPTANRAIYFNVNPQFDLATNDDYYDPHNLIQNVLIHKCKGHGFEQDGRSETRLLNVYADGCHGHGFAPSFDSHLSDCTAAACGLAGFYIESSATTITGCKAFYNGQIDATAGHGLHITGNGGAMVAGFDSQDNMGSGMVIGFTNRGSVVTALSCDSNSRAGIAFHPGIYIVSSSDNLVRAIVYERNAFAESYRQRNALRVRNSSGSTLNNDVQVTHRGLNGAVLGTHFIADSDAFYGNHYVVNGQGGSQAGTFAASYTPNQYLGWSINITLTGNITIAAPAEAHPGDRLRFILTQDGTGTRTTTFAAAYKTNWTPVTTAAKVNVIEFEYNGTSWLQTSAAVGL